MRLRLTRGASFWKPPTPRGAGGPAAQRDRAGRPLAGGGRTEHANAMPRLSIRVDLGPGLRIGPGKIALLETIDVTGSISAARRGPSISSPRAGGPGEEVVRSPR